jgi:crotonobetainyl-CoA:carnitine CoA-transferase CaiB-like acyl-CoA transferase
VVNSGAARHTRPLAGLTVVELGEELGPYAGKLLADAGARVIKVEPPGGDRTRQYGPFLDDEPGPERSLAFAFYNTGKESVVLDLAADADRETLRALAEDADVVVDGLGVGRLGALGLTYDALKAGNPGLILVAITPFGREGPWAGYKSSDLVALALGGPLFDCGYDDHSIPPIRGSGGQAYHTVSHLAMNAVLIALLWRQQSGEGQFVDLSMHAACVTTVEFSNVYWFCNQTIIQRQTCRHAAPTLTQRSHFRCADGRYVWGLLRFNDQKTWESIKSWLDEKGLLLDLADPAYDDPVYRRQQTGQIRERLADLAALCTADEFYHRAQQLGNVVGVIRAPEELPENPHLQERGFFQPIEGPAWGRSVLFPGAPYRFSATECRPGRPPTLGEHNARLPRRVAGVREEA